WDHHSPRACTRRPKCRLCGSKDHLEGSHRDTTHKCVNCHRPAPADHRHCPVRPSIKQGVLVRVPKSQIAAIRHVESAQRLQGRRDSVSTPGNTSPEGATNPTPTQ